MPTPRSVGPWLRSPAAWTRGPRRRRLAFVLVTAPGALLAVLGAELRQDPVLLLAGSAWCLAAMGARRWSEPRFLTAEAGRPLADEPPIPDHSEIQR
jgi:hypothetical protein